MHFLFLAPPSSKDKTPAETSCPRTRRAVDNGSNLTLNTEFRLLLFLHVTAAVGVGWNVNNNCVCLSRLARESTDQEQFSGGTCGGGAGMEARSPADLRGLDIVRAMSQSLLK